MLKNPVHVQPDQVRRLFQMHVFSRTFQNKMRIFFVFSVRCGRSSNTPTIDDQANRRLSDQATFRLLTIKQSTDYGRLNISQTVGNRTTLGLAIKHPKNYGQSRLL